MSTINQNNLDPSGPPSPIDIRRIYIGENKEGNVAITFNDPPSEANGFDDFATFVNELDFINARNNFDTVMKINDGLHAGLTKAIEEKRKAERLVITMFGFGLVLGFFLSLYLIKAVTL